jgi:hypothetical protein
MNRINMTPTGRTLPSTANPNPIPDLHHFGQPLLASDLLIALLKINAELLLAIIQANAVQD